VFVVKGVAKRERRNFLTWQEGKGPDLVIDLTSASTREEDQEDKFQLYQDVLQVREYFLFDPIGEYLQPRLQGFSLQAGRYAPIAEVNGRLPSGVLGLQLEVSGSELRFCNPATGQWLPTPQEALTQATNRLREVEARLQQLEAGQGQLQTALQQNATALQNALSLLQAAEAARLRQETENDLLRRQVEELRKQAPDKPPGS
jgi:hypothetical protein